MCFLFLMNLKMLHATRCYSYQQPTEGEGFQTSQADCPWQKLPQTDWSVWCCPSMSGLPRHMLAPFNFESKWESLDVWNRRKTRQGERRARWDDIVLLQSSDQEKIGIMRAPSPTRFLVDGTCRDALEPENLTKVTFHTKTLHSDFPGGSRVKTPCFQFRQHRFHPWLEN